MVSCRAKLVQSSSVRSRAPLRLGLAGGGTDLSPYCDEYGGSVLNVTIDRHAYASISPRDDNALCFVANDLNSTETLPLDTKIDIHQGLRVHRAVYSRIVEQFHNGIPLPLTMTTWVECPMGSGLGASSALAVAMIGAFQRLLSLPLGEFDIAHMAYEIEREDLGLAGGRQDQYAATFGGLNFMEFMTGNRVIVNPLKLAQDMVCEFESSLLLCFTGTSRDSSVIIDKQRQAMTLNRGEAIEAMHRLKRDALEMKAALLQGELSRVAEILTHSWSAKKNTARGVSNEAIDTVYKEALASGAKAGKISGAGGGGFMMLLVDPVLKNHLRSKLESKGYQAFSCLFTKTGMESWNIPEGC